MHGRLQKWLRDLDRPIDAASLAFFRIAFGTLVAIDGIRFFAYGWIDEYFILPEIHFTYIFFDWVRPWPGNGMYVHFAVMIAAAICVSLGLFYRTASILLFLAYGYFFLLEQSIFMNHYYLILLVCFLLALMPAHRACSVDAVRFNFEPIVPRWTVWILRFQLFVVYFYGGLAKINRDWLRGEPMYSALLNPDPAEVPEIAGLLPPKLLAYSIAYAGLLIDLTVPFLLVFPRTVMIGFAVAVVFHVLNAIFLKIGIFSYLAVCAITIFFRPDWPRQWFRWRQPPSVITERRTNAAVFGLLFIYVVLQILVPLRHFMYPGYVSWTEEGHRFAWHMKLRRKVCDLTITYEDLRSGQTGTINPTADLRPRQIRKLKTFPDIMLQYVHHHRDRLRAEGIDPAIRVDWICSLNGNPPRRMVDPEADLARAKRTLWHSEWLLPFEGS